MQFDICDLYANITEDILRGAIEYAKQHTKATSDEAKIIFQTKKAFIFKEGKPWMKKGNRLFDVTMGSWDRAEICELIGLFRLSQLSDLNLILGLYCDDGLAVTALKPRQAELAKKKICRIFKDNGFNITIEANVKSVNFLDVNLNLETGMHKPYMKPMSTAKAIILLEYLKTFPNQSTTDLVQYQQTNKFLTSPAHLTKKRKVVTISS